MGRPAIRLLLCLTLFAFCMVTASGVSADVGVSVAPSLLELRADPGGEGTVDLTVYNEGAERLEIIAAVEPYKGVTDERAALSWLRVEPSQFTLAPGEQRNVHVTIRAPRNAESGGRYAMVTFQTAPQAVPGSATGVSAKLGVPFLIAVPGEAPLVRQASLDRIMPVMEADGRVGLRALFTNHGHIHVGCRGSVEVCQADGTPVGRLEFPQLSAILPQTSEWIRAEGTLPLLEGAGYEVRARIDYAGKEPAVAPATTFNVRPALEVTDLSARENLDRGPTVSITLRNSGEVGLEPNVQLALRDAAGNIVAQATAGPPALVAPGEVTTIETDLQQRLSTGTYIVLAHVEYPSPTEFRVVEREAKLRIGNPPPTPNPAWMEAKTRPVAVPKSTRLWWVVPALLVAAAVVALCWLRPLAPTRRWLRGVLQVGLRTRRRAG